MCNPALTIFGAICLVLISITTLWYIMEAICEYQDLKDCVKRLEMDSNVVMHVHGTTINKVYERLTKLESKGDKNASRKN